jgi:hypothetical protein
VEATIVAVPRQRNTREENEAIKRGQTPEAWKKKPAIVRARAKIGLQNLAYNIRRLVTLERMAVA